jgi:RNA polymerase sigma-70 factor, ECF subfamily
VRRGRSSASAELLRTALESNGRDLLAYFERRVAEPEDAADLLAETYLVAWKRIGAFPIGREHQRMWLFVTARNVHANARRAGLRRAELAGRLRDRLAVDPLEIVAPVDDERRLVRDAVDRLPAAQRELVSLVHWDGFTIAEAAHIVGVNPSTARGRYAAARGRLRTALRDTPEPSSETDPAAPAHAAGR